MKTLKINLFSRVFLMIGLLALLLFNSPAAAVDPVKGSQGRSGPAGLQPALSASSLLTIPEVPAGTGSPKADGACTITEYAGGLFVNFVDGPGVPGTGTGNVYLIHDANYLYMCITSPMGTLSSRFDRLYLDATGDGPTTTWAQKDDYALQLNFSGGKSTYIGTGVQGGWEDVSSILNDTWDGAATTGNLDVAEYAVPLANFNLNVCTSVFGLAGYHHHFATPGNDYGWPSNQFFDQPGTWQMVKLSPSNCGNIAYVYNADTKTANSFYNLLTAAGYTVATFPLTDVLSTDFAKFDLTILADDTGSLDQWGTLPYATTGKAQVDQIAIANKPILGLGEGGYAFFGRLSRFIGWPMGWHGPQDFLTRAAGYPAAIFSGVSADPVQYYSALTNSVGVYLNPAYPLPSDVTPVAMEVPADDHSSLIQQGCDMLWGNSGGPDGMTSPDGSLLFLNTVGYLHGVQCPNPPPPPAKCGYTLEKTAVPASGSQVAVGSVIEYTLTYHLIKQQGCPSDAMLVDVVPPGTEFLPGSASDGISPGPDGALVWTVGTSAAAETKTFSVQVTDTFCPAKKDITNVAELRPSAATPLASNSSTHTLNCNRIAYVYRDNTNFANSFNGMLTTAGYTVTLVPLGAILSTDFSKFDLTILADDTGSLDQWGTPPYATTGKVQVDQIATANKPILGLGEGGYAFFGRLMRFIGWPRGWHGPQNFLTRAAGYPTAIFSGVGSDPVQDYSAPTNNVGIYTKTSIPSDVTLVAMENPPDDHASIIQQGCDMLWGNSGGPAGMTSPDGSLLFLNTVGYTLGSTCPEVPPPPTNCGYTLEKTAVPSSGGGVAPGDTIQYTLTYHLIAQPGCPSTAKLVDVVPFGTNFVPGSATDGISPGPDGALIWTVGTSAGALTKKFSVQATDILCTGNKVVTNVAQLLPDAAAPLASNPTTHTLNCPPIGLPNTQPMFAEDELKADPYPLVSGTSTRLSVRVHNLTSSSVLVTVQFQVAPASTPLGVGLAYTTVATSSATLPGSGMAVLEADYRPDTSGNRCFQALVSTPSMTKPLSTQSCLDLTEDFQPGHTEHPVFVVHNNTSSSQTYLLVVDNNCPGWTASVDTTTINNLAAGASQNFTLNVTPPDPLTLGSGCHIDVQVWDGTTLVGGIRKLDLPPVHLPTHTDTPPWEEPEITFNPDPPVEGVPGQICIQLENPLSSAKHVTVNFSVADFGAGIDFTPAASTGDITLPAHSLGTYCASWTPAAGGTLHRCVLATLVQAGALDQHSQHNIDIVHPVAGDLSGLEIPFVVGNPGPETRNLGFEINLVGIDPMWVATILTPGGNPPPTTLPGGGTVPLVLHFSLTGGLPAHPFALPSPYAFGSQSRVAVTLLLDGYPESGFSVSLESLKLFLPIIMRH